MTHNFQIAWQPKISLTVSQSEISSAETCIRLVQCRIWIWLVTAALKNRHEYSEYLDHGQSHLRHLQWLIIHGVAYLACLLHWKTAWISDTQIWNSLHSFAPKIISNVNTKRKHVYSSWNRLWSTLRLINFGYSCTSIVLKTGMIIRRIMHVTCPIRKYGIPYTVSCQK